jgi:hypothetical protein
MGGWIITAERSEVGENKSSNQYSTFSFTGLVSAFFWRLEAKIGEKKTFLP